MHEDASILLEGLGSITFWLRPEAAPSRSEADILPDPDKGMLNVVIRTQTATYKRSTRLVEQWIDLSIERSKLRMQIAKQERSE